MHRAAIAVSLSLQTFVVLFILLHDWIPLGPLNNLNGIGAVDPLRKRIRTTLLSTLPFALPLGFSLRFASSGRLPMWLVMWLWIAYGLALLGAIRAWWWPYLGAADPARAARYRVRFAHTHSFLPDRNGIVPDTLHVALHTVLLAELIVLTQL